MKFRVTIYGGLDEGDLAEARNALPTSVRPLSEADGSWRVEFAVEAASEQAAIDAAEEVAGELAFELGHWDGIDAVEFQ